MATFSTLGELYEESVVKYRDNLALSMYEGESLTYGDIEQRAEHVVKMLREAGVGSKDKVVILSSNMPNWGVCYLAVVSSGMIAVPILPDFSQEELNKIIEHSEAKALLVSDKLYAKINKKTVEKLNIIIRTKNLGITHQIKDAEEGVITPPTAEDMAVIIYTSGTTSIPKGVMLTHGALANQMDMLWGMFPIQPNDVLLSILPLSHTLECSVGFLYPFMCGANIYYIDKPPTAATLMPAMKLVRPTIMLSVPLIIDKIFRSQVAAKFKTGFASKLYSVGFIRRAIHRFAGKKIYNVFGGRLRFFGIGGAKLDPMVEQFLLDCKFPYAIGYGLTETAPIIAGATPDIVRIGSTGPILPVIEYRLENVNKISGEGELVVKSPSMLVGYYKNEEATKQAFTNDGFFRTNDLCAFDSDGFLYIKGRANNMIVGPSGENIYPEEIENVINSHFAVYESIVQEEKGRLVALVHFDKEALEKRYNLLKEGWGYKMEEIQAELMSYVNSKVSKFSRISTVRAQDKEFEKTPTKKIKRFLYKSKK